MTNVLFDPTLPVVSVVGRALTTHTRVDCRTVGSGRVGQFAQVGLVVGGA
jgi:hypothetical protein